MKFCLKAGKRESLVYKRVKQQEILKLNTNSQHKYTW